jgi:N-acetylglucosaminyl-diphospho-decaprenol L-rhamnosyltransferase
MGLATLVDATNAVAAPLAVRPHIRNARPCVAIETPQLSVVIVNYCQWQNTARLTRQLRNCEAVRRGAAEIVIVDNNSPKQAISRRLRKMSGVSVVRFNRNYGFARAVNKGSNISRGEWVLLLNPDVSVCDGFLDQVLESAQRFPAIDPNAGVVGFQMRHRDGTKQASAGIFPTLFHTVAGLLLPRARRKCQHQALDHRQPVPWVTGGCLLVRRDCFEQLRGMDERFFLYYEDVDFCRRARASGWSVWYEPELRVTHHFPLHTRRVPPPLRLVTRHALMAYAQKHWTGWQSRLLGGLVWTEATVRERMARQQNDLATAECFRQMRELVGDIQHQREEAVATKIRYAATFLSEIASSNDGKTELAARA